MVQQTQYISLPQARTMLMSRMSQFAQVLALSMASWVSSPPGYLMDMDQAARATIIHRFWYGHCQRLMAGDPGIRFQNLRGQRYLVVDDAVLMRFKLVNRNHLSSNMPTLQSLRWNAQMVLDIPDQPELARLEFAYLPDATWTRIERAYVLFRHHKHVVWLWQVWGAKDDVFEFAHVPGGTDMLGRLRFAYNDFSI